MMIVSARLRIVSTILVTNVSTLDPTKFKGLSLLCDSQVAQTAQLLFELLFLLCRKRRVGFGLDRAHRIGQTRPVTYYDLVARNTVDEKILVALRAKRDLAREVMDWREWLT